MDRYFDWYYDVADGAKKVQENYGLKNNKILPPHTVFIGIAGKKQVGKNTSAELINKLLHPMGVRSKITAFANPLKEMCINVLGLERTKVYGTDADKNAISHILWDNLPFEIRIKYSNEKLNDRVLPRNGNMSNREVLQVIGTDIFRIIYPQVWASAVFNEDFNKAHVVLIADTRFPNEIEAIEKRGGFIINIKRNTGLKDSHSSETALDDIKFKHEIINNGSMQDLENNIKNILFKEGLMTND